MRRGYFCGSRLCAAERTLDVRLKCLLSQQRKVAARGRDNEQGHVGVLPPPGWQKHVYFYLKQNMVQKVNHTAVMAAVDINVALFLSSAPPPSPHRPTHVRCPNPSKFCTYSNTDGLPAMTGAYSPFSLSFPPPLHPPPPSPRPPPPALLRSFSRRQAGTNSITRYAR